MAARASITALNTLLKSVSIDDHEEILDTATAALDSFPQDHAIRHTKVIALLKLDRFGDALHVIDEGGVGFQKRCLLESAYANYKTGSLSKARECLLPAIASGERSVHHLDAQVAYRAENFTDASKIYQSLSSKSSQHEEIHDLKINELAAVAQLGRQGHEIPQYLQHEIGNPDSFELAYNAACIHLSNGLNEKALQFISLAKQLCDSSDELSDEEKQEEIVPILIQLGYTYFRMDLLKDAGDVYRSINPSLSCDADSALLQKLNSTLISLDETSSYLTERMIHDLVPRKGNPIFFGYQRKLLDLLELTLDLNCHKSAGVRRRTSSALRKSTPGMAGYVNRLSVLNAAASLGLSSRASSGVTCQDLLKHRPSDLGLLLTTVELCIREHNLNAACKLVENFISLLDLADSPEQKELRFTPGLVALLVSLYRAQGRQRSITTFLSRLATSCESTPQDLPSSLLRGIGLCLIASHQTAEVQLASTAFSALLEKEPTDDIAEAGFVASNAGSSGRDHLRLPSRLFSVEDLVGGIIIKPLLDGGVVFPLIATSQAKRASPSDYEKPAKRRRRKAVGAEEGGKQLDPERWLPLRDRSSYRPKGKRGKKRTPEATQGGIVKDETIELVGGAGAVKVEKAAPAAPKKKRKGRK